MRREYVTDIEVVILSEYFKYSIYIISIASYSSTCPIYNEKKNCTIYWTQFLQFNVPDKRRIYFAQCKILYIANCISI